MMKNINYIQLIFPDIVYGFCSFAGDNFIYSMENVLGNRMQDEWIDPLSFQA